MLRPIVDPFRVKLGLIITQTDITQELTTDMRNVKIQLTRLENRMTRMEEKLDTILTLLKPS